MLGDGFGFLLIALLKAPGYLVVRYGLGLEKKNDQVTDAAISVADFFFWAIVALFGVVIWVIFFRRS